MIRKCHYKTNRVSQSGGLLNVINKSKSGSYYKANSWTGRYVYTYTSYSGLEDCMFSYAGPGFASSS